MNRKIYRGKRVDNGKWVCGYIYEIWNRAYILWGMTNGVPDMVEVDPHTVGAYVCPSNVFDGEIFEGDIIKSNDYTFVVRYGKCGGLTNNPNYGYIGFYLDGADAKTKKQMYLGMRDDIMFFINGAEVIGNIHDNPELIEEEEK